MTKKRVAKIPVENCLDCPHHKEISDPGSDDSFDMFDTSIVCTKQKTRLIDRWNPQGFRHVSVSERPNRHRKLCDVPAWCPLLKENK